MISRIVACRKYRILKKKKKINFITRIEINKKYLQFKLIKEISNHIADFSAQNLYP